MSDTLGPLPEPRAWVARLVGCGDYLRSRPSLPNNGDPPMPWEPLYTKEALDAAVAAERGRWKAAILNEIGHAETNEMRLVPSFGKAKGALAVRAEDLLALVERA